MAGLLENTAGQAVIGSLVAALSLSLILNIFFCISKCCSAKKMQRHGSQRSQTSRQMEENPIYGNLTYPETKDDPPRSSLNSSSVRDQHRVNLRAQNQDCYANLALKAPRAQSGCSSSQAQPTQYSDVMHLEEPAAKQEGDHDDHDDDGVTDGMSVMSDLYASVQTQRAKTIDAADGAEGYANHL